MTLRAAALLLLTSFPAVAQTHMDEAFAQAQEQARMLRAKTRAAAAMSLSPILAGLDGETQSCAEIASKFKERFKYDKEPDAELSRLLDAAVARLAEAGGKVLTQRCPSLAVPLADENASTWGNLPYLMDPKGIIVTEGLLRAMDTEDELAAVLGHELGHAFTEPGAPIDGSYDQFELRADEFSISLLKVAGFDPGALNRTLEKGVARAPAIAIILHPRLAASAEAVGMSPARRRRPSLGLAAMKARLAALGRR